MMGSMKYAKGFNQYLETAHIRSLSFEYSETESLLESYLRARTIATSYHE